MVETKTKTEKQIRYDFWRKNSSACYEEFWKIYNFIGQDVFISERMEKVIQRMIIDKLISGKEIDYEGLKQRLIKITKRDYPDKRRYPTTRINGMICWGEEYIKGK